MGNKSETCFFYPFTFLPFQTFCFREAPAYAARLAADIVAGLYAGTCEMGEDNRFVSNKLLAIEIVTGLQFAVGGFQDGESVVSLVFQQNDAVGQPR